MRRFPRAYLESITAQLAEQAGVSRSDAAIFARILIDADVHGTATHGISRLSIYLERIELGLIDPRAELVIDQQSAGVIAIDARSGLGQVQAMKTIDLLIPRAKKNGVAAATIRNSQHFGALSCYCNRAAEQDMILLAMTNCEPAMSPTGGYEAFFGTNPIAASFPAGASSTVKVDLATSIVARGNIIAANKKKVPIPEGWALSSEGEPTVDPAEALRGTVLTMAGHKGYALALLVETFSGILSGAAVGSDVGSMYKDLDRRQDVGHFFCLFDIAAFLPPERFTTRMQKMIERLKGIKRRPGVEEILIPGERSQRAMRASLSEGVPVDDATVAEIQKWCDHFGVAFNAEGMEAQTRA